MSRRKYKWAIRILFMLLGILIGVVASNWSFFELDSKLGVSDLLNVIITTMVGIYIANSLANKQNIERSEKDFLIDEIKEIKLAIKIIKDRVGTGRLRFEDAKISFKNLNQNITHLESICKMSDFSKNIHFHVLRTSFSTARKNILNISPQNGEIVFNSSQKQQADINLNSINSELYKLIHSINAC